ncbi:HlyD family efflux transporter periplasmic adaptor subunit [Desulfosporosinus sp. PR]|uniref:efflux RND transporter periplasmic adaptor subunit n=1 Tax=Candidatus Desulfosporosinus nitrosoreducens TaxID=3401928 RepID=UPI0027F9D198|nr:HlyD family efflux transporter periplasmic adaptor subunit [Desulfosporosinus sp. PR]MDQ7092944.1 HlyD family efflux transporter periplasmic adaptor subunit [Desulfosporosinus sp. PR]
MKKQAVLIFSLILGVVMLGGCGSNNDSNKSSLKTYPVKTLGLKEESRPVSLEYEGITGGSEVRKLSFKSTAKIAKIYVPKGQAVKKGDPLVDLDKTDLNFAMEASKAQMDAASAQYNKAVNGAQQEDINKAEIAVNNAQNNYSYYKDLYEKNVSLYNSSAISKQALDGAKLQLDSSEAALNSAQQSLQQLKNGTREEDKQALLAQLNATTTDYNAKRNLLQDASLVADTAGYVVDVLCKEGELQAAGNPVILLRSENQVVTVGLSDNDVKKIGIGTKAQVKIDDLTTEGEITNIVQMADMQSGTYSAEIKLLSPIANNKFFIGENVKVYISVGEKTSLWIPISSILNDGEDYVYVVESGRAVRKNVTLGDAQEDKVAVEGLKAGDKLVIEGMKNIKAGYQVIEK